jgi:hypothetical protein
MVSSHLQLSRFRGEVNIRLAPRVQGTEYRVWDVRYRIQGMECKAYGIGDRV